MKRLQFTIPTVWQRGVTRLQAENFNHWFGVSDHVSTGVGGITSKQKDGERLPGN